MEVEERLGDNATRKGLACELAAAAACFEVGSACCACVFACVLCDRCSLSFASLDDLSKDTQTRAFVSRWLPW